MSSREQVFARGALQKGLVSRAQAEECLAIAAKLARARKPLPIEDVFVRKGYLRATEARALARRIRKKVASSEQPALALEVEPRGRCPNCGKDPGRGDDCFRCGADLTTGAPGPRATLCDACGRVVLRGSAICPRCAAPIGRAAARAPRGRGSRLLDRLILLATLGGMAYFLVYRNLIAPPASQPAPTSSQPAADPLEAARAALAEGERARAVRLLEAGLAAAPDGSPERRRLLRGLALVAPPERARAVARELLANSGGGDVDDALLRRRLGELELAAGHAKQAAAHLRRVPAAERGDAYWRLRARAERAAGGDWVDALARVEALLPPERRRLAAELARRGRTQLDGGHLPQAEATLRRAVDLDGDLAAARAALGVALLRQKRPADAQVELEQALKADPRPAGTYLALGLALEQLGEGARALELLREYVRLARAQGVSAKQLAPVEARIERLTR